MQHDDSYQAMLAAVQAFHDKHDFKHTGGEEMTYRVALMSEELGEISSCVTKGKSKQQLAEEAADLFILLIGTAIAGDFDLRAAFWSKISRKYAAAPVRNMEGYLTTLERTKSYLTPADNVLEIGCGTGHALGWIRGRFRPRRLAAVDLDMRMLAGAAGRLKKTPRDPALLAGVETAFNDLDILQGAMLTYAPDVGVLLSGDPFGHD